MILLGLASEEKRREITEYCKTNNVKKIKLLTPEKFDFSIDQEAEHVEYTNIIEYAFFYRLMQEVDDSTLLIVNECLRTQNRYDLTYNCIRNFLNQTKHQLIFQHLPIIDNLDDFMILFDFDTRSRWKREKWDPSKRAEVELRGYWTPLELQATSIETSTKVKTAYIEEKHKLIEDIGLKDPHTIPRNLYLLSGKMKLQCVDPTQNYIGRNNRFKLCNLQTYRETKYPHHYTVFEFCHNFIDFSDFLALSRQDHIPVLVADLKVDQWYFQRYLEWTKRVQSAYTKVHK
jgi:hypothetical protein